MLYSAFAFFFFLNLFQTSFNKINLKSVWENRFIKIQLKLNNFSNSRKSSIAIYLTAPFFFSVSGICYVNNHPNHFTVQRITTRVDATERDLRNFPNETNKIKKKRILRFRKLNGNQKLEERRNKKKCTLNQKWKQAIACGCFMWLVYVAHHCKYKEKNLCHYNHYFFFFYLKINV